MFSLPAISYFPLVFVIVMFLVSRSIDHVRDSLNEVATEIRKLREEIKNDDKENMR